MKQYEIRGQDDAENPETGTGVGLGEQLPKDQIGTLAEPSDKLQLTLYNRVKVCQNSFFEEITPIAVICSRG